jgi:4-hydroxy-3-polyprenylbenzoate decarboxylase
MQSRILVAVTGASGSIYAERLVEALTSTVDRVYVIATETGKKVVAHELAGNKEGFSLSAILNREARPLSDKIRVFANDDLFSPVASGSSAPTGMVVVPCSMGTLGRIAGGMSTNLIERAADVMLKESKPLVICPRETPLNRIHLTNMIHLVDAGAKILPPVPAFYNKPKTIDDLVNFVVGRILAALNIESELMTRWNSRLI